LQVDLSKDWSSADLKNGVGHGDKGERRNDDLVALADAQREQSQVQSCGAGADGNSVGHAMEGGQRDLEGIELGPRLKRGVRRTAVTASISAWLCPARRVE